MKLKIFLMWMGLLFFFGSNRARSAAYFKHVQSRVPAEENFDQFFKKFNTDRAFQLSRVVFPLKMLFVEDDSPVTTKLLEKKNWVYENLLSKKFILKKMRKSQNVMLVTLQMDGTGVYIEHFFQMSNGAWKLVSTKDSSD